MNKELLESALREMKAVCSINLSYQSIGDEDMKVIAAALEGSTSMIELHLSYNSFGVDGIKALAAALEKSTTITTLYLTGNFITNEGVKALAEALEKSVSMTELYFSDTRIINSMSDFASLIRAAFKRAKVNRGMLAFLSTVFSRRKRVCTAAAHFIWRDGDTALSCRVILFLIG